MELLQWTSLVYGCNKQNKQLNEHELHINKILPLQSPLLLSRCMVMNNGQCVLLFPDDILPTEISTEAVFMSGTTVPVLNTFCLISFFFQK